MSDQLTSRLSRLLREAQRERRAPSVSGAVAVGGDIVWAEAVGVADAEAGTDATPATQYRVGSITKTFTAAAIFQLRDEGKLDIDDRLGDHLPGHPVEDATLRRLLSHLSGLQREVPGDMWETFVSPSREAFLASLGEARLLLRPGQRHHYSNLAFALLGEVVTRRAGMRYERYVDERLIGPAGLRETTWLAREPSARGYFVHPYADRVHLQPDVDSEESLAAAGQLWSTPSDLARWGAFLQSPDEAALSRASAEEMTTLQVMLDLDGWTLGWGLGVDLIRRGTRVFGGHSGGMPGHLAGFTYHRGGRVSAGVLTNAGSGIDAEGLAVDLAEAAADDPVSPVPWRAGAPVPPEVEGLLGRWWSEGFEFVFSWRDGVLEARSLSSAPGRDRAGFEADGPDRWRTVWGREQGEDLIVVRDDAGVPVRLYWATYPFLRDPVPWEPTG